MKIIPMEKKKGVDFARIFSVIFVFFLIQSHVSLAQRFNFEFDPLNALPDITCGQTTAIVEDSVGYLWIGTEEGLFRYDGKTTYPYLNEKNNPRTLPSNHIQSLVLDRDNHLWIATSAGLVKYNREFDNFTSLPDKSEINGFRGLNVKVLTVDPSGKLYVAYQQSLYQYQEAEGQFSKVIDLEVGRINSLVFDNHNNLWIGTAGNGGLFCLDQQKQLTAFRNNPQDRLSISTNEINELAILGETLWIGTSGKGIDAFDLKNRTFKNYSSSKKLENYINSIFIGPKNEVWICTYSCLKRYNPKADNFANYYYDPRNPYSVEKGLNGFYEDRAGNYWTIHSSNGVRVSRHNVKFDHIEANAGVFWTTSEKIITALRYDRFEEGNSRLWIGNYYNGVDIFSWKNRTTVHLKHEEDNPRSIGEGTISALFVDSNRQMWVGSYPGGLQRYNYKTNDFDSFRNDPRDTLTIAKNDVRSIAEDKNGDLWLAIQGQGVDRYDIKNNIFYHYNQKNNQLCNAYTCEVLVDSRGNLWVATAWGLGFLPKGERIFKNYYYSEEDTNSISHNEIHTVYEDNLHQIWVGTDGGLNKFDYETQKFTRYSKGLKNKHISAILSDKNNEIWVSTKAGISKLNSTTGKFFNYDQNYGLLSKEFIDRSCLVDSEGKLFFGGTRGFDSFFPDNLKPETRNPKVVLTDFKLFNRSISCRTDSQIIDRHISYAGNISLDYFQNSITFLYQALSLTEAQNIEYTYKLDGFDKEWVSAGKETGASYTNLNPGKYTFRVKAKYENGEWSPHETTVELNVRPAWWMTWWFRIVMVLIATALMYIYVNSRIRRLRKQRKTLKTLVEERTWEIQNKNELLKSQALTLQEQNNQLKELNATKNKLFSIIAHDLRGPFNVILGFQSILVNDYSACTEAERISMVKKTHSTAQKVYALVENLLNWARIQTNNIHYNPVQFDLRIILMQRLDLYEDIARAKGIHFQNQLPEGLIAFADIDLLETIVRNLINNAVKYTPSGGTIQLMASEEAKVITISVVDSGIGLTPGQIETLFCPGNSHTLNGTNGERGSGLGLLLCKEFVDKNKGSITIQSEPKKGSTFSFTIPAFSAERVQAESN